MRLNNSSRYGFTMIEMLVVMILIVVGMAVAAALFNPAMADSRAKQCYADQEQLANAEEQYKLSVAGHTYTTTVSNLASYGTGVPICPDGGTYSVTISDGTATAKNGTTVPA